MMTRLATLVLSVACLCGVVPAATAGDSSGARHGTTYAALPLGAPTSLPWWQHRRLHVGSEVIRTRRSDITSRGGTTVIATSVDRRMGQPATWFLVDGGRLARLPMRTRTARPLISANGEWLAWLEVRAHRTQAYRRIERYRVVVYDVARQRITNSFHDRRLVAWEDGINGIWLRTLSNKGRLVLSQGSDGVKVLPPRGRLARFRGPRVGNGVVVDGWPRGTTVFRYKSDTSVYGVVARHGRFDRAGRFAVSWTGLWSAGGGAYAYEDEDGPTPTYWVRQLDGETLQLDAPQDAREFDIVGWESADAVILWFWDDYSAAHTSQLVRCFTTTGACERVPGGPKPGSPATMAERY
jgi:hypothetical protein